MSELKDKETEQVVGGTFIPTFVPEYEEDNATLSPKEILIHNPGNIEIKNVSLD